MEVNFDTYPGYFNCNISWGDCEVISGSQILPYGYYAEPSSFFNSYLPNFSTAYGMMTNEELNGTIWMNGFQSLHMHGSRLNCNFLCFPSTANHISIANSTPFNGHVNFQTTEWYNVHYNNYTDKKNINQFNVPLIIKGVTDFSNAFRNCNKFNQYVHDFENCYYAEDCSNMFASCLAYNQNVNIPASVNNTSNMFFDCNKFNAQVYIPGNGPAMNCTNMFAQCDHMRWSSSVITDDPLDDGLVPAMLPSKIVDATNMFRVCTYLNSMPGIFWNTGTLHTANYMFFGCNQMANQLQLRIPDNTIQEADSMFRNCKVYNPSEGTVEMGVGLINTQHMFENCYKFNTNVNFGPDINNATCMFYACNNYNCPLEFWRFDYLNDASLMYAWCSNLDQNIEIVSQIYNARGMFSNIRTAALTHDIFISNSCNIATDMFWNCREINVQNISIVSNSATLATRGMFGSSAGTPKSTVIADRIYIEDSCTQMNGSNFEYTNVFSQVNNLYVNNLYVRGKSLGVSNGFIAGNGGYSYTLNIGKLDIQLDDGYPYASPAGSGYPMIGYGYGKSDAYPALINELILVGNQFPGAFIKSLDFSRSGLHINHINIHVNNASGMFWAVPYLNTVGTVVAEDASKMFRNAGNANVDFTANVAFEAFFGSVDCNATIDVVNARNMFMQSTNAIVRGVDDTEFQSTSCMFNGAQNYNIDGGISDITVRSGDAKGMFQSSTGHITTIRIPRSDTRIHEMCINMGHSVEIYTHSSNVEVAGQVDGVISARYGGNVYVPSADMCGYMRSHIFRNEKIDGVYYNATYESRSGNIVWTDEHGDTHREHKDEWPAGVRPEKGSFVDDNRFFRYSCGVIQVIDDM